MLLPPPSEPQVSALYSGKRATLNIEEGAFGEFVLCSHISGDRWYCHGGVIDESGRLDKDNPFDPDRLLVKNVCAEAVPAVAWPARPPKKRVRAHAKQGQLEGALLRHAGRFHEAVAVAHWKAEQLRAEESGAAMDVGFQSPQLGRDPLVYPRGMLTRVGFHWSWEQPGEGADGHAVRKSRFSFARLDNLLEPGRIVPVPKEFTHMRLRQALEAAADSAVSEDKAPCVYLGACLTAADAAGANASQFVPDPANFPRHSLDENGRASHAMVWRATAKASLSIRYSHASILSLPLPLPLNKCAHQKGTNGPTCCAERRMACVLTGSASTRTTSSITAGSRRRTLWARPHRLACASTSISCRKSPTT